ncbi:DUF2252 domain-containing protein [Lysobacter enzymogenes]|uniref:DUF2252 domain-containing protein n=1 Tax=Lysobacter enzymogenes TaxID=69 RepID=UPI00099C81DD|nr:DUF2252 family protein [Lysobacter enzymogenes]UZW59316.1 DUF2252 family protein [Lysobacter enzymogenes]
MPSIRTSLLAFALVCAACAQVPADAASARKSWVVQQIHDHNHPYAASASGELDTKLATMAGGPFAFYRGTAHLFFQDMATLPGSAYASAQTGYTWIGGDMHLGNFDAARDSSGKAVFKVADFDEGYLGQYVWDLRRLAASLVLAGRDNGLSDAAIGTAVDTLVGKYVDQMGEFKGNNGESGFRLDKDSTTGAVDDTIDKADGKTRASLLSKYTAVSGGARRLQALSNLVALPAPTYSAVNTAMAGYVSSIAASKRYPAAFYTLKDARQKLGSGVGSLGRARYYVLIEGATSSTSDDVILEFKQEAASAVAAAAPGRLPASAYDSHEGLRVARTAKAQVSNAEVLIGHASVAGVPFYVHEKSPFQEDFDPAKLDSAGKLDTAAGYLGQALASAHALADQDYDSSVVSYSIDKQVSDAVTSKSGLKSEVRAFAFAYAAQVELDWEAFVEAYEAGTPLY